MKSFLLHHSIRDPQNIPFSLFGLGKGNFVSLKQLQSIYIPSKSTYELFKAIEESKKFVEGQDWLRLKASDIQDILPISEIESERLSLGFNALSALFTPPSPLGELLIGEKLAMYIVFTNQGEKEQGSFILTLLDLLFERTDRKIKEAERLVGFLKFKEGEALFHREMFNIGIPQYDAPVIEEHLRQNLYHVEKPELLEKFQTVPLGDMVENYLGQEELKLHENIFRRTAGSGKKTIPEFNVAVMNAANDERMRSMQVSKPPEEIAIEKKPIQEIGLEIFGRSDLNWHPAHKGSLQPSPGLIIPPQLPS